MTYDAIKRAHISTDQDGTGWPGTHKEVCQHYHAGSRWIYTAIQAVPIPLVDRGRGDPCNILGIVLSRNENDLYTICVKSEILKRAFTRNQFDICPNTLLQESDATTAYHVKTNEPKTMVKCFLLLQFV